MAMMSEIKEGLEILLKYDDNPFAEIARLNSHLEFLRDKGITVGPMKSSDRDEPYLAYVIRSGSELDDSPAILSEIEAQREIRELKAELEQLRKATT